MSTPNAGLLRGAAHSARLRIEEITAARRMRNGFESWVRLWPTVPVLSTSDDLATTVVLPCYNHARHLPQAVQSLVEQSREAFDAVLVDDCSQDETPRLLDDLAAQLRARGEVTVLHHERNLGQAATLNEAMGLARTPLVTVLNDDDWLTPGLIDTALDCLREAPELALVGAGSQWFEGSGRPPTVAVDPPFKLLRHTPDTVRSYRRPNDLNMTHSGMTVRTSAWQTVGGYRSDPATRIVAYSDRDFQLRVAALYPVAVIDAPLVWWRSDSSVDAGRNS